MPGLKPKSFAQVVHTQTETLAGRKVKMYIPPPLKRNPFNRSSPTITSENDAYISSDAKNYNDINVPVKQANNKALACEDDGSFMEEYRPITPPTSDLATPQQDTRNNSDIQFDINVEALRKNYPAHSEYLRKVLLISLKLSILWLVGKFIRLSHPSSVDNRGRNSGNYWI